MWTPKDEAEIVSVVNQGALQETATFEAKRQVSTDNTEIAKDIAAMTNNGGVIFYGIGEDADKRLTVLSPVELAGQPERINSIARTAIDEPPSIHVHTFPTATDPTKGYMVVEVPPSPRAPHMVTVGKRDRFYGRTSAGNYHLTEGEVARLYARRQQTEVDRATILQQEIRRYSFELDPKQAYLITFVRPVYSRIEDMLGQACQEGQAVEDALWRLVRGAKKSFIREDYSPRLSEPYQWVPTVDGYRGDTGRTDMLNYSFTRLELDHNGDGHFFCNRAADTLKREDREILFFFPEVVAGNVAQFLYLFGSLYEKAEYNGQVDLGVAVIGLKGCFPYSERMWLSSLPPYDQEDYRRTIRCLAQDLLSNTRTIAAQLVMPLIRTVTQGYSNPFPS